MAHKTCLAVLISIACLLFLLQGNSVFGKSSPNYSPLDSETSQDEDKITHQKRRYWIDELSDCIDMYCKKYINSDFYVKCMMANCPEGVLITSEKRSRENFQDKLFQGHQMKASELETSSEISGFYNPSESEYVQAKDAYFDPETLLLKRLKSHKKIYSTN